MESVAAPSGPAISDQALLDRLQQGDEAALGALYDRYAPLLYSLAVRVVGDRQLAQKVLQDTLLRCWDQAERYDPARGRVPAWLIGVTRHRAIDVLRSRSHQARLMERDTLPPAGSTGEPGQPDHGQDVLLRRTVFRVNVQGEALAVVVIPVPLEPARAVAVTEEPAPGSPGPTGPHLLDRRI